MGKLKKEIKIGDMDYSLFRPKPFHLFRENFQELNIKKRIRFFLQALRGSFIYYAFKGGNVVGYIVFEPGKGFRYPFTEKRDLVISPYVVKEDCRGQGIGTRILIDSKKLVPGRKIYALVMDDNISSIKAMEKAGYTFEGYAEHSGIQRKYVLQSKKSEFLVYSLNPKDK